MAQIVYQLDQVNFETLDAALRGVLGKNYDGLSVAGKLVKIHLAQGVQPPDVQAVVDAAIAAHNPNVLTPAQQAAADRQVLIDELNAAAVWNEKQEDQALRLLWDIVTNHD